jgi:hypothetical protein
MLDRDALQRLRGSVARVGEVDEHELHGGFSFTGRGAESTTRQPASASHSRSNSSVSGSASRTSAIGAAGGSASGASDGGGGRRRGMTH